MVEWGAGEVGEAGVGVNESFGHRFNETRRMNGFIGITDFDWYSFLRAGPAWEEVNFWQPSANGLLNPPAGMPFFFKLRTEYGSPIVGFGHFSWRTKLPAWMAWDTFGTANGAAAREQMLARISRLRRDPITDPAGRYEIGCLVISRPVFFDEPNWLRPPADWPLNVQRGKSYDVSEGEGQRIYMECLARAAELGIGAPAESVPAAPVSPTFPVLPGAAHDRFGAPVMRLPRLGQGAFRVAVADVYSRRCAVSGEHSLPALEAAHIRPYAEGGSHELGNGILLRADIHRLFDQGFVTVTPDHHFLVSPRLKDDYENGRVYYDLEASTRRSGGIHLPSDRAARPKPELLEWHSTERFVR